MAPGSKRQPERNLPSQYHNPYNVEGRFGTYLAEECEPGRYPFEPEEVILELLEVLGIETDARFLDEGTGDGHFLDRLWLSGYRHLYGIDPNDEQFSYSQRWDGHIRQTEATIRMARLITNLGVTLPQPKPQPVIPKVLLKGDAKSLDFPDESFDVVCANSSLYHLREEELPGVMREIERVLTPSGILFVVTSGKDNKLEHRDDELVIAKDLTDVTKISTKEPLKMNSGFTTEKAGLLLPKHFSNVFLLDHRGWLVFNTETTREIYRRSQLTMHDQYDPVPRWEVFEASVDRAVIIPMQQNEKRVRVHRSVFVASKADLALDQRAETKDTFLRLPQAA